MSKTTIEFYLCVDMLNVFGRKTVRRYKKKTLQLLLKDAEWYLDRPKKYDVWAERHTSTLAIERAEIEQESHFHGDQDQ